MISQVQTLNLVEDIDLEKEKVFEDISKKNNFSAKNKNSEDYEEAIQNINEKYDFNIGPINFNEITFSREEKITYHNLEYLKRVMTIAILDIFHP